MRIGMLVRSIIGVLGLISVLGGILIGKLVNPNDPVGWFVNVYTLGGILVALISWGLWPLFLTAGRYIRAFFYGVQLSNAWARLVIRTGSKIQLMTLALVRRYMEEEVKSIDGRSENGKHFIVTNFVAYSGLVSAAVHKAHSICPDGSEVVCFATLTMPLSKWFNFSEIQNPTLCYCQVHPEWEKYTVDLRGLVGSIKIRRCTLAVIDAVAGENKANPSFAFKGETEIKDHCNYWVLVPTQLNSLVPIQRSRINEWITGPLQPLLTDLRLYEGVDSAYLILPNANKPKTSLPSPKGYRWSRLGSVFLELFHSQPRTDNARCRVLTAQEWHQYFRPNLPEVERMPEDLFIIGFRPTTAHQDPRWVLCIAADVDNTLDKLALEFISENLNKRRFELITDYVNWLYGESSEELQDWLMP